MLQKGFNFMAWVQYGKTQYPQWIASLLVEKFCNLTSRVLYWVSKVLIKGKSSKVLLLFFAAYQIVSLSLSDPLELLMCGFKCLGFFTIYIIIEYLLIFIGCFYHHNSALIAIVKLTLIFSMGVSFVIIIIGFGILISCSKKISLTYFCATIQYCEMYLLLIEIEHSYYELFFATPLIFYFLHLLVFYGAKKLESPEVEQLNNSDHSITRISGEISQWLSGIRPLQLLWYWYGTKFCFITTPILWRSYEKGFNSYDKYGIRYRTTLIFWSIIGRKYYPIVVSNFSKTMWKTIINTVCVTES